MRHTYADSEGHRKCRVATLEFTKMTEEHTQRWQVTLHNMRYRSSAVRDVRAVDGDARVVRGDFPPGGNVTKMVKSKCGFITFLTRK